MLGSILRESVFKDSAASRKAWLSRHRAVYVDPNSGEKFVPLKRVGEGKDAHWESNTKTPLSAEQAARAAKLAIPPGWTEVFMHTTPDGNLQAFGFDKVGKKQPRYSEAFQALSAEAKWQRVKDFHKRGVKPIAQQSAIDMLDGSLPERDRDTAALVNLVLKTGFRPGSEANTQAQEQAYGASTLEKRHIKIAGDKITFSFVGKKGVQQSKTLTDPAMARFLHKKMGKLKAADQVFTASDKDALAYVKRVSGDDAFKTKDLRTWNGTGLALALRKQMPVPKTEKEYKAARKAIGEAVADHLGNTPTMALTSYIAPYIFAPWNAASGVAKAEVFPSFEDLMDAMDEAIAEDTYKSPVDWHDFEDADLEEVPASYRDNLDGIQSVRQTTKHDIIHLSLLQVLKENPYRDEVGRYTSKERAVNGTGQQTSGAGAVGGGGLLSSADTGSDSPRDARTLSRNYHRGTRSNGLLNGVAVDYTPLTPTVDMKAACTKRKFDHPTYLQLEGENAPKAFMAAMDAAKAKNPSGASVYQYGAEDYAGMKLFLTEGGTGGIAVKPDGDIVSVFNTPGTTKGMVFSALRLAVGNGGRKLDCFDTKLPHLYSKAGFTARSRLKWDDEQAPSDWSKADYKQFNNGEPDVVFMTFDPNRKGRSYSPTEGSYASSYDEATATQQKRVVKSLALILKTSEASKKAWITIKLKKQFGTADTGLLKDKLYNIQSALASVTHGSALHADMTKQAEALSQYLNSGDTSLLVGMKSPPKPKMQPIAETPAADLMVKPKATEDYFTADELTEGTKPKYEAKDTVEATLDMNQSLGKAYYKLRNEKGLDDPETKAAYEEWQKAKDDLTGKYGYTKDQIGSLSLKAKEAVQAEDSQKQAAIANAKMKGLAELKDKTKEAILSGAGADNSVLVDKLKAMGVSDSDIDYAFNEGVNAAAAHHMKVKQAAETDYKKALLEYEKAKDKFGPDSPEAQKALGVMGVKGNAAVKYFDDSAIANMQDQAHEHYKKLKEMGTLSPDMLAAVEQYDSDPDQYDYIDGNHPKYQAVLNDAKDKWNKLPQSTQSTINSYTGSGHKSMNKTVAVYSDTSPETKRLKKALDVPLPAKMLLRRNMSARWFMESFGLGGSTLAANSGVSDEDLQSLVGKAYVEKAFSSTTNNKNQSLVVQNTAHNSGAIYMKIRAGAATRGMLLPYNTGEGEVLLQSGAIYVIRSISRLNGTMNTGSTEYLYQVDVDVIGHKV